MKSNRFQVIITASATNNAGRKVNMLRNLAHYGVNETRTPQDFVQQALAARRDKGTEFFGCGITCVFIDAIYEFHYPPDYPHKLELLAVRMPALEN